MFELLIKLFLTFVLTGVVIKFFKPLAEKFGLLDQPGGRKQHQVATPLIGGLALYVVVAIASLTWGRLGGELYFYLFSAGVMVVVGALDDRFHLGVRIRIVLEVVVACCMIFGAGIMLRDLGDIIGVGSIVMPMGIAVPFTIIAILGTINCLNMIDGLDGLAAGLALQSIITYVILIGGSGSILLPVIALIAGLMTFLVFNLQLYPKLQKIFLGDAGSMLLGFTLVWLLARNSQVGLPGAKLFEPVNALFILGLPLLDMVATIFRRAIKKKNPFKPDRTHVHHILLHAGFNPRQALVFLLICQFALNSIGVALDYFEIASYIQFAVFLTIFIIYFESMQHAFRFSQFIQTLAGGRTQRSASKIMEFDVAKNKVGKKRKVDGKITYFRER